MYYYPVSILCCSISNIQGAYVLKFIKSSHFIHKIEEIPFSKEDSIVLSNSHTLVAIS